MAVQCINKTFDEAFSLIHYVEGFARWPGYNNFANDYQFPFYNNTVRIANASDGFERILTFEFPEEAVGLYAYGWLKTGMFHTGMDCGTNCSDYQVHTDSLSPQTLVGSVSIFSYHFPKPENHTLRLHIPAGAGVLYLDRFELEVPSPSSKTTTTSAPTPIPISLSANTFTSFNITTTTLTTMLTSTTLTTITNSSIPTLIPTYVPNSESLGSPVKTPRGAIIGGLVAGVVVLFGVLALLWYCWRRKRREAQLSRSEDYISEISPYPAPKQHDIATPLLPSPWNPSFISAGDVGAAESIASSWRRGGLGHPEQEVEPSRISPVPPRYEQAVSMSGSAIEREERERLMVAGEELIGEEVRVLRGTKSGYSLTWREERMAR